jgi:glycosyltransferase involved in cell wall biosynthesis
MKVSIITATYNSAATVLDTLKSVANQDYKNIEHIIIDGVSKDNTIEIIKNFGHSGPILIEKDKGIYDAMNKGIALATGDIVAILNSDDFYASNNVISNVVAKFKEQNSDLLYGDLHYVNQRNTAKVTREWISGQYKITGFLSGWMPPHPAFFVKSEVYKKYGNFNLALGSAADYELMLRFMYKWQLPTAYLHQVLVKMRVGGASSKNIKSRIKANINDRKAWTVNELRHNWLTLYLKPLRKLKQFL